MFKKSIAIALSSFLAMPAQAALLTDIQGKILVNQGDGFSTVSNPTELKAGDRVLVRTKSSAKLLYGVDCAETLKANRTYIVPNEAVCHNQKIGSLEDAPHVTMPAPAGAGMGPLLIGGLFVTGISIAALADDDDHPASP